MRGGVSQSPGTNCSTVTSSPHAWGCFLLSAGRILIFRGLPHMRGGVSTSGARIRKATPSSPHAWGCFLLLPQPRHVYFVFPTCVGVFLEWENLFAFLSGLPHMRGGVSGIQPGFSLDVRSSPYAWGCFSCNFQCAPSFMVFPTYVGCFSRDGL